MAATRLIALHINKGKTVAQCLADRTDYSENAAKTEDGKYISAYACDAKTCDEEFLLSKRQYEHITGRTQAHDVIAYQIRQSFKPGEITPEEANKVGYETAMRFTKGKHAFIVATHVDRAHIHNHIIFNSTTLDSTRKFRDFRLSGLALARLSDIVCLEHRLSVIIRKPCGERQKRTEYPVKKSQRDEICEAIDAALARKPKDFRELIGILQEAGYEYKDGKQPALRGKGHARFARFRSLGKGYSVEELCEGVEEPRGEIQYIHYFCGVSGQSEESDEIYARLREKLYRLVSSLVRAFAEAKPYLVDDISSGKLNEYDKKVTFYIELKKTIGTASGDFLDLKAYEPDMRKMIDNYITAADAEKIGDFDDLTLLDFVAKQGETLTGEGDSGHKEGAAEAIENNIRKKVIEKVTVNPRYYAKMSEILDKLIEERKQGVLDYAEMLEKYIKLAKDVDCPEDNDKYPESIRKSKALMAIYDNTGEDEKLALRIHKAVKKQALSGFRDNQVVVRRIKKALFEILGDDSEVERIYKIIEKQEEY